MAVTNDPISDLLTRVRNALQAGHEDVSMPDSRLRRSVARILKEQGYIVDFSNVESSADLPGGSLTIELKYSDRERTPAITGLRRISRPGRRVYVPRDKLPKVQGGMGTAIISTSRGVITGHDARKQGVGGEVLAEIW